MGKDLKGKELGVGLSQRPDGRYYARTSYKGHQIAFYGFNYQEMKKRLKEEKQKIDAGKGECDYTLSEWFEEWFDTYKAPSVKKQSITPMKSSVKRTFLNKIGDMKIVDLRSRDFQLAVNDMIEEGKIARSTISEALGRLKYCLASAVNNGHITVNPAFDVLMPSEDKKEVFTRWLNTAEISQFLRAAESTWWYETFYIMIYTGMRIGEVGGLKECDIHWSTKSKNGYIELKQAFHTDYIEGVKTEGLGTLKTANSYRKIPFIRNVEEMFRRQLEKVHNLKEKLGPRYRGTGEFADLVFVTSMGSPCTRYVAEHAINRLVKQINIDELFAAQREKREAVLMQDVYPHALRHTFATLCYYAGMDAKATQALMGHANYSTTINIYTHLADEEAQIDVSKLNALALADSRSAKEAELEVQKKMLDAV